MIGGSTMYPLKVVLVGNDESLQPHIRRELLNLSAEVDSTFPDIESALEALHLRHEDARLFVIHLEQFQDVNLLKHFSGKFAGRPILVLMDAGNDPSHVVSAIRHGASQVVTLPFSVGEFTEAMESILVQFGHLVHRKSVIAVTAAHGGAGSTSIAVNVAYEIAQQHRTDTIIMELQASLGSLASFLDVELSFTIDQLLDMGHEVDLYAIKSALAPFGERLSVLAGPTHARHSGCYEIPTILNLIQDVSHLSDVLVLDVPAALDDLQLGVLRAADQIILVTEQTVPSIQMTIEMLKMGIRAHAPTVVVNRYEHSINGFDSDRLMKALEVDCLRTIANDSAAFHGAVNRGQPLRLTSPRSRALADIDSLVEKLLDMRGNEKNSGKPQGMLSRLAHLLQ